MGQIWSRITLRIRSLARLARSNLKTVEAVIIIIAITGAAITLSIGGFVKSDTIRIVDVSNSTVPPYGELNSSSTIGYSDNYTGWTATPNEQVNTTQNSLVVSGVFQNASTSTSVSIIKNTSINITSYPILTANVDVTTGVSYGIRFYAQYPNGTEYNVWWGGSPLDHRPGLGYESLRVNMQREASLAAGHDVEIINRLQLYVEDSPHSPQSFQLTLSKLSFENYSLEHVSNGQYRAVYFDLKNPPQENASWYLNKIDSGVTIQASQGTVHSIYFFEGQNLYSSSTTGIAYTSLTSFSEYPLYPTIQLQIFPELLPQSKASIVFVVMSGTLQSVTMNYANFEFLPTTTHPDLSPQSVGLYYVYFIFFLFLLPVGIAILVFREFLSRKAVPRASILAILIAGVLCRIALAATTNDVFDINVFLTSTRGWFQYRTPVGSLGPTLPFTFFLYWIFYSPFALLQLAGFQDVQFLGHAAGLVEAVSLKLFPMTMDVTIFFLLLRFRKDGATFVWATFYFLNPFAIFVSAVWGQYEAATVAFIVWGVYWMSRQRNAIAALAFVVAGMVELLGFLPYALLLLRTARMRMRKALLIVILAMLPVVLYPPEAAQIFRILLGFAGVNLANSALSQPGRYSVVGNFSELSIISQFKPLLVSETIILGAAIFDTYRHRMDSERLVFYTALSSIFILLFANLFAVWFWVLPVCLLYAIVKQKNDLGAFMLVFGTSLAFLEVAYAVGSRYVMFGEFGPIVPAIEAIDNARKILSIMVTALTIILLLLLKYGSGEARQTIVRTSAISFSIFLLLYFWLGVYQF